MNRFKFVPYQAIFRKATFGWDNRESFRFGFIPTHTKPTAGPQPNCFKILFCLVLFFFFVVCHDELLVKIRMTL